MKNKLLGLFFLFVFFVLVISFLVQEKKNDFIEIGQAKSGEGVHEAILLPNGNIVLINYCCLEIYDPKKRSTVFFTKLNKYHSAPSAILLPESKIAIVDEEGTEIFNINTQSLYSSQAGMISALTSLRVAIGVDNARILVVPTGNDNLSYPQVYDFLKDQFSLLDIPPKPRVCAELVKLKSEKILILSKSKVDFPKEAQPEEIYNPVNNKITMTKAKRIPSCSKAALLPDGNIFISNADNTAELYMPSKEEFTKLPNKLFYGGEESITVLDNGDVLIAGGRPRADADYSEPGNVELFDFKHKKFRLFGRLNHPRYNPRLTKLSNGKVLITGGWIEINNFFYEKGIMSVSEIEITR